MDLSQSEERSGTINELRAVVRAELFEDVCASRASTVRMDARTFNGKQKILPCFKEGIKQLELMKNVNISPASQVFYLIGDKVILSTDMQPSLGGKDYE